MKGFEYHTEDFYLARHNITGKLRDRLNKLGQQGYELVNIIPSDNTFLILVFKRPYNLL